MKNVTFFSKMYEAKMLPDTRNDPHAIYFDLLIGLLFVNNNPYS